MLHVTRLKLFIETRNEAYKVAILDADQFVIQKIHLWRGDPAKRYEMFFYTEFTDGDKVLLPYFKDLSRSAQFEEFVFSQTQLFSWRFNANDAPKRITAMRREPIRGVNIGDVFYLDLRHWGYAWFGDLDLPDTYATTYVVTCEYHAWQTRRRYRCLQVRRLLFNEIFVSLHLVILSKIKHFAIFNPTFCLLATEIACCESLLPDFDVKLIVFNVAISISHNVFIYM